LRVSRKEPKHRGHVRMHHARALGDPTDAVAARALGHTHSARLRHGVRGHDGAREVASASTRGRERGHCCGNLVEREATADDAGGAHQDELWRNAQALGSQIAHRARVAQAALAHRDVGTTGIHDQGLSTAARHTLATDRDWSAADAIFGEYASHSTWAVGDEQTEVEALAGAIALDACVGRGCHEALRRRDAAVNHPLELIRHVGSSSATAALEASAAAPSYLPRFQTACYRGACVSESW
jgi:hypothetical protein